MKSRYILIVLIFLIAGCKSAKFHDSAEYNKEAAIKTIKDLKTETIIVVIPTYTNKEKQLKNLAAKDPSKKEIANNKLVKLYADRELAQEAILDAYYEYFTFTEVLFIPDYLLSDFESGKQGAYFLDIDAKLDPNLKYTGTNPVKIVPRSKEEWHIMTGNKMIPNPFPNNFVYNSSLCNPGRMKDETPQLIYDCLARLIQREFSSFYTRHK